MGLQVPYVIVQTVSYMFCFVVINYCSSNPCMNGATCTDGVDSYICECVPGYTGVYCETSKYYYEFAIVLINTSN